MTKSKEGDNDPIKIKKNLMKMKVSVLKNEILNRGLPIIPKELKANMIMRIITCDCGDSYSVNNAIGSLCSNSASSTSLDSSVSNTSTIPAPDISLPDISPPDIPQTSGAAHNRPIKLEKQIKVEANDVDFAPPNIPVCDYVLPIKTEPVDKENMTSPCHQQPPASRPFLHIKEEKLGDCVPMDGVQEHQASEGEGEGDTGVDKCVSHMDLGDDANKVKEEQCEERVNNIEENADAMMEMDDHESNIGESTENQDRVDNDSHIDCTTPSQTAKSPSHDDQRESSTDDLPNTPPLSGVRNNLSPIHRTTAQSTASVVSPARNTDMDTSDDPPLPQAPPVSPASVTHDSATTQHLQPASLPAPTDGTNEHSGGELQTAVADGADSSCATSTKTSATSIQKQPGSQTDVEMKEKKLTPTDVDDAAKKKIPSSAQVTCAEKEKSLSATNARASDFPVPSFNELRRDVEADRKVKRLYVYPVSYEVAFCDPLVEELRDNCYNIRYRLVSDDPHLNAPKNESLDNHHGVMEMNFTHLKDLCNARNNLCKHLPEVYVGNRSPTELIEDQADALIKAEENAKLQSNDEEMADATTTDSSDATKPALAASAPIMDIERLLSDFNVQWFKEIRHFPHPSGSKHATLCIPNLPLGISESLLQSTFPDCRGVFIARNHDNGDQLGYACLDFGNVKIAEDVLKQANNSEKGPSINGIKLKLVPLIKLMAQCVPDDETIDIDVSLDKYGILPKSKKIFLLARMKNLKKMLTRSTDCYHSQHIIEELEKRIINIRNRLVSNAKRTVALNNKLRKE